MTLVDSDKERFTLYLSIKSSDYYTPVFEVTRDVRDMMCGLFNVHGKIVLKNKNPSKEEKRLFLCSDLCASSSIVSGKTKMPVLRQLVIEEDGSVSMNIQNVLWLDTADKILRTIRLYITDGLDKIPPVEECILDCTVLVFPKKKNY